MKKWKLLPILVLLAACVDPIIFPIPPGENHLVVDGKITNEPGPYEVILSTSFNNRNPSRFRDPVVGAQIDLYEDGAKVDSFTETSDGVYKTSPGVVGKVGKIYSITIKTKDNKEYASDPELLLPPGELENVVYEFEPGSPDRFNIYLDAKPNDSGGYMRWRVNGTYKVISFPEKAISELIAGGPVTVAPLPCSGYIAVGPTTIVKVGPCTCCECWVDDKSPAVYVSDKFLGNGAEYPHTKVGEVKITRRTFFDKYHVDIEQFSISPETHEFFRQAKAQAEGAGSLFQPAFGEIQGNVHSTSNEKVLGVFWAAGVSSYSFILDKSNVPYELPAIDTVADDCRVIGPSSYTKPPFW